MEIKVKKLTNDAILPTYATDGSACFDIYTSSSGDVFESETFETGLSFEIPNDHLMLVFSRSGHGFKNDVRLANCVGVIDSDYRGELKVKLTNDNPNKYSRLNWMTVEKGDRIAQGIVLPYERVQFNEVEELSESVRGKNGFGSTGIR